MEGANIYHEILKHPNRKPKQNDYHDVDGVSKTSSKMCCSPFFINTFYTGKGLEFNLLLLSNNSEVNLGFYRVEFELTMEIASSVPIHSPAFSSISSLRDLKILS